MFARFAFDFRSFNAGVLVLDLERMRRDAFCEEFLPFAERYGMNDQEVLNCYAGPNRRELDAGWNRFPSQEPVSDGYIVHWAGSAKPWGPEVVPLAEEWEMLVARNAERRRERL